MPSEQPPTRVEKIIGICRNPSEPFYWDADRIGEPCPNACHTFYDDGGEDVPYPHEFYVQVDSAPPSEQPREGTRVKVVFTRAEAEALLLASDGYFSPDATNLGLGANKIAAALEPAQPQPGGEGDDLAARLERIAEDWERLTPDEVATLDEAAAALGACGGDNSVLPPNQYGIAYGTGTGTGTAANPHTPKIVQARFAAWRVMRGDSEGNFHGESPSEQRYMSKHWPTESGEIPAPSSDLAERLEGAARYVDSIARNVPLKGVADDLREAASALRASTHPEQSARVDLSEFGRWTIKAEETEGGYRNVVLGDPLPEGASIEVIEVAALAAPTPTEQGEARADGNR